MTLNPELSPYCHLTDYEINQALQLFLQTQSDFIFVNNHSLRLLNASLHQQILLVDRYPQHSQFAFQDFPRLHDCLAHLLLTGHWLVQTQPFTFEDAHWTGFNAQPSQVTSPQVKSRYTSPLIPLLKIANLSLPARLQLGLRSLSAVETITPVLAVA